MHLRVLATRFEVHFVQRLLVERNVGHLVNCARLLIKVDLLLGRGQVQGQVVVEQLLDLAVENLINANTVSFWSILKLRFFFML